MLSHVCELEEREPWWVRVVKEQHKRTKTWTKMMKDIGSKVMT
jgi:hypothetical protein